jgi:hypothetical protein
MKFNYYYNNVPGKGPQRNNLIYTSLISNDKKVFVQWYYNDPIYHQNQNEVVDESLMEEKWRREIKYIKQMSENYADLVPQIVDIDEKARKIYLKIDGDDFWNRSKCSIDNYKHIVPNWEEQILSILQAHKNLGLYKFSLHPSSYWLVDGQLKSINYFFAYHESEKSISIADHSSHIYSERQEVMKPIIESMGLSWNRPEPLNKLQHLCFESFRKNYTDEFITKCRKIYND